eukprot:Clim_evm50s215 gene=Clim_evmTU50s215
MNLVLKGSSIRPILEYKPEVPVLDFGDVMLPIDDEVTEVQSLKCIRGGTTDESELQGKQALAEKTITLFNHGGFPVNFRVERSSSKTVESEEWLEHQKPQLDYDTGVIVPPPSLRGKVNPKGSDPRNKEIRTGELGPGASGSIAIKFRRL